MGRARARAGPPVGRPPRRGTRGRPPSRPTWAGRVRAGQARALARRGASTRLPAAPTAATVAPALAAMPPLADDDRRRPQPDGRAAPDDDRRRPQPEGREAPDDAPLWRQLGTWRSNEPAARSPTAQHQRPAPPAHGAARLVRTCTAPRAGSRRPRAGRGRESRPRRPAADAPASRRHVGRRPGRSERPQQPALVGPAPPPRPAPAAAAPRPRRIRPHRARGTARPAAGRPAPVASPTAPSPTPRPPRHADRPPRRTGAPAPGRTRRRAALDDGWRGEPTPSAADLRTAPRRRRRRRPSTTAPHRTGPTPGRRRRPSWEPADDARRQPPRARPARATPGPRPELPYVAAFDGLRAVALFAILAFHQGFEFARGGFLGISSFFTLSGFLAGDVRPRRVGAATALWRWAASGSTGHSASSPPSS